jgi:hypothetical protein
VSQERRLLAAVVASAKAIADAHRAWRDAHDHAVLAYESWCRAPGPAGYTAYRAAQDRADAAQAALSRSRP